MQKRPPAHSTTSDRSSDQERQTLTAWAAGGAVNGEPSDLPAQPTFSDGWALGTPDVVLEMQEDYHVPAKGTVQYEWLYIPTNFTEAKWVKSLEIRPGNRSVVHHVLIYYRAKPDGKTPPVARANQRDQSNPPPDEPGVSAHPRRDRFGGNAAAPDRDIRTRDESAGGAGRHGVSARAWRHPRASDALHRDWTAGHRPHESGHHLRDRTGAARSARPAFHEHDDEIAGPRGRRGGDNRPRVSPGRDGVGALPAYAPSRQSDGPTRSSCRTARRNPSSRCRGTTSTGRRTTCSQNRCRCRKGSKIVSTAWYDNSAANKSNPNPNVDVFWGDQTWQEMQYTGVLLSPN